MNAPRISWQQAAHQMYSNLDAVLNDADKEFVSSVVMLAESGEPIAAQALPRLTSIYKNFLTIVNTKTSDNLSSDGVFLQSKVPWQQAVSEMNDNIVMLMSEDDKEFVQGIALLLEMGEAVSPSYIPRVESIYKKYRFHQDL